MSGALGAPRLHSKRDMENLLQFTATVKVFFGGKPMSDGETGMTHGEKTEKVLPGRTAAWGLLCEYTLSESLRKHALAVEACMRAYARRFHESGQLSPEPFADELELWGLTGLLHDFDYEKHPTPQEHPFVGNKILEERGYPDVMRRAILSHAEYTGVPR